VNVEASNALVEPELSRAWTRFDRNLLEACDECRICQRVPTDLDCQEGRTLETREGDDASQKALDQDAEDCSDPNNQWPTVSSGGEFGTGGRR